MKNFWEYPEEVRIVIGTKGRTDKQITLEKLWQVREKIDIVCHPDDYEILSQKFGGEVNKIEKYPIELDNNLGKQRQWIVENTPHKYLLLLDDNLSFHTRTPSMMAEETKYPLKGLIEKHFPKEHIRGEMLNLLNELYRHILDPEVALVGLSQRSGNNRIEKSFAENTRIFGLAMVDLTLMKKLGIRYDAVNLKQDFYVNLSFLTRGYKNICLYNFAFDKPQANMAGGCSTYRTPEKSNQAAEILKSKFPDFVRVREKSVKSWGGEFDGVALDVTVQWKKAYEYGRKKKNFSLFLRSTREKP